MSIKIAPVLTCLLLLSLLFFSAVAQESPLQPMVETAPDEMPTHLVKVLRTTNKAQVNQFVAKVYEFKNVNPHEIANFVANGLKTEEGGIYTFVHPDGNKGKMLVFCPEYQIEWLDKVCAELDRPRLTSAPGSKYIYYRLKHRAAADPDFLQICRYYASTSGVVWPDIETNSLLLFDSPSGALYCERALNEYLDAPTQTVALTCKIYEVEVKNDGMMGLDYEMWKNGPGAALFATQFSGQYLTATHNAISYLGYRAPQVVTSPSPIPDHFRYRDWYRGYGYRAEYPSAFFDFLVEKGKAKILVNTRICSSSDEPALIRSVDFISYFRVVTNDVAMTRSVNSAQAQRRVNGITNLGIDLVDTGVYLRVRPVIGTEHVNLALEARVVNHLGWASNGDPLLSSFQIDNEFRAKYGEEILIGGLTRERLNKSTKKVPILGDLPVLGWIFGGEADYLTKSIIVVSFTPALVENYQGAKVENDDLVMQQVAGEADLKIPSLKVGFDQYLLDGEK